MSPEPRPFAKICTLVFLVALTAGCACCPVNPGSRNCVMQEVEVLRDLEGGLSSLRPALTDRLDLRAPLVK